MGCKSRLKMNGDVLLLRFWRREKTHFDESLSVPASLFTVNRHEHKVNSFTPFGLQ